MFLVQFPSKKTPSGKISSSPQWEGIPHFLMLFGKPDEEGYCNFLKLATLNEVHYIFLRSHQINCSDVQAIADEIHFLTQCQNSEIS